MAGGGALLVYSGLKNKKFSSAFRNLISGKSPANAATAANETIQGSSTSSGGSGSVGGTPPSGITVAAYKTYAGLLLTAHGWTNQYGSFNNIVMAESGWNNQALNQSSGAYGIAQALGHGNSATVGSHGNNYGNYGTSNAVCKLANNGNGNAQIQWMLNYIGETYGNPNSAWSFHEANGYY